VCGTGSPIFGESYLSETGKNIDSQAAILKAIAHPVRLKILKQLMKGPSCVQKVNELLELSQPNLSQHLAALKKSGLVDCRVDGVRRCYFLCRPTLAINLLELLEQDHRYMVCEEVKKMQKK